MKLQTLECATKNDAADFLDHMTPQVEEGMAELRFLSTYAHTYLHTYLPYIPSQFTYRKIYFHNTFLRRWLVDQLYTLYTHSRTHTCMYVCMYMRMYVCTCIRTGGWTCVCMCVCGRALYSRNYFNENYNLGSIFPHPFQSPLFHFEQNSSLVGCIHQKYIPKSVASIWYHLGVFKSLACEGEFNLINAFCWYETYRTFHNEDRRSRIQTISKCYQFSCR